MILTKTITFVRLQAVHQISLAIQDTVLLLCFSVIEVLVMTVGLVALGMGVMQSSVPEPPWEGMLWDGKAWPWIVQLMAVSIHARVKASPAGL